MTLKTISRLTRLLAAAALLALALGVSACGDSDDGGEATANGGDSSGKAKDVVQIVAPDGASDDEKAIYDVYDDFIDGVVGGDPEGACEAFTPEVRRNFEKLGQKDRPCPAQMRFYFAPQKDVVPPDIVRLDVNGKTATALVRAGKSKLYPVDFSKVADEWKVNGGIPEEK
jgi:hypothetical protein